MKKSKLNPNIPRRAVVEEMSKVEKMILDTVSEIENLGADERLTNAQVKLQDALDLISDFEDENMN